MVNVELDTSPVISVKSRRKSYFEWLSPMSADVTDLGVSFYSGTHDGFKGHFEFGFICSGSCFPGFHGVIRQSCEDGYVLPGLGTHHVQPGDFCADCYGKPLVQKTQTRNK